MRIEYEGVVEQQATYSHVGYVSVASTRMNSEPGAQAGLGIAALGLMLALMAYGRRSRRTASIGIGIVGLLMLVSGGLLAATRGGATEKYYPSPYTETSYRLHSFNHLLNAFVERGDDLPAELPRREVEDFQTAGDVDDPNLDAWGRPFKCVRDMPEEFGRPYNVISAGADGEFGTVDDIDLSVQRGMAHDRALRGEQPWPDRSDPPVHWEVRLENED